MDVKTFTPWIGPYSCERRALRQGHHEIVLRVGVVAAQSSVEDHHRTGPGAREAAGPILFLSKI